MSGEIITKPLTSQHGLRSIKTCNILTLLHISGTKPKFFLFHNGTPRRSSFI